MINSKKNNFENMLIFPMRVTNMSMCVWNMNMHNYLSFGNIWALCYKKKIQNIYFMSSSLNRSDTHVPLYDPNVIKTEINFFIKYKWFEWFPLISLYNTFRVLWAYYFLSYISCIRGIMSTMLIIDWNRVIILPQ